MPTLATPLMTAEEFAQRPQPADGSREELVRGEIETMPPTQLEHGLVQMQIGWLLKNVVTPNRLGWVVTEAGVVLERNPDTVRGPDVSFYSIARCPERPSGYSQIPADIVVEVLSPSDRSGAVREKVRESVAAGVAIVWVVDPETKTVREYRGTMRGVEYDTNDPITGGDVLPAFTAKVADFFG